MKDQINRILHQLIMKEITFEQAQYQITDLFEIVTRNTLTRIGFFY